MLFIPIFPFNFSVCLHLIVNSFFIRIPENTPASKRQRRRRDESVLG